MKNIYSMTMHNLEVYFENIGENKAKARIIFNAIYKRKVSSFDEIETLSNRIKKQLESDFFFDFPNLIKKSEDSEAVKVLLELSDENLIEAVLMNQKYGSSICISTQIGCNMACKFCESGKHKKKRNLEAGEMVAQIMCIEKALNVKVKTVAVMGIGEPFENFENVMNFLEIVNCDHGLGIGNRHITVSTCGIAPKIEAYAKRGVPNSLAISLHAANDELRSKLMPINILYPLEKLKKSLELYVSETGKKVFLEYVMLDGVNDGYENAIELANFAKNLKCTVNLIGYNETKSMNFKRSSFETMMKFYDTLKKNGIHVTIRRELGSKVKAACGQLKSEYESNEI